MTWSGVEREGSVVADRASPACADPLNAVADTRCCGDHQMLCLAVNGS